MQPTHQSTVVVVVVHAAAAAVLEGPTEEPTGELRAGSVESAKDDCHHGLPLSWYLHS